MLGTQEASRPLIGFDVGLVDISAIGYAWPDVHQLLEDRGQDWARIVDFKDVFGSLLHQRMEMWIATEGQELAGVLFASWARNARESTYFINYMVFRFGFKEALRVGLPMLERYVLMNEGTYLEVRGRPGWVKVLERRGYKQDLLLRKNVRLSWSN